MTVTSHRSVQGNSTKDANVIVTCHVYVQDTFRQTQRTHDPAGHANCDSSAHKT